MMKPTFEGLPVSVSRKTKLAAMPGRRLTASWEKDYVNWGHYTTIPSPSSKSARL